LNDGNILATQYAIIKRIIQNSSAVKKGAAQKGHSEKRCEIQGGGHEVAVMVG